MSDAHKEALARGRAEGRAVRNYLNALEENRPRRGRKRTPDSIKKRLDGIEQRLQEDPDPLDRLHLVQERIDLEAELHRLQTARKMTELEAAFVDAAPGYGERKGISYSAWREAGVPASVLKRAGIRRSA